MNAKCILNLSFLTPPEAAFESREKGNLCGFAYFVFQELAK